MRVCVCIYVCVCVCVCVFLCIDIVFVCADSHDPVYIFMLRYSCSCCHAYFQVFCFHFHVAMFIFKFCVFIFMLPCLFSSFLCSFSSCHVHFEVFLCSFSCCPCFVSLMFENRYILKVSVIHVVKSLEVRVIHTYIFVLYIHTYIHTYIHAYTYVCVCV